MELKQYLLIVWRWTWLLVLCAMLGGVTAFFVTRRMTPTYEANTILLVDIGSRGYNDLLVNQILAKTFESLMNKQPVLAQVIANLNLDMSVSKLANKVLLVASTNGQLLTLTVSDSNPQRAADIANEIAKVFSEQDLATQQANYASTRDSLVAEMARVQQDLDQIQASIDALKAPLTPAQTSERQQLSARLGQYRSSQSALLNTFETLRLRVPSKSSIQAIEVAVPPSSPVWPRVSLNVAIATLVAGLAALGPVFLIEYLDESLKSSKQITELTGLPTLVTIGGHQGLAVVDRLATVVAPRSQIAEAYRQLRRMIENASGGRPVRTIAITSSSAADDTGTIVANLAGAMIQTGKRVIVVDADLRKPSLHTFFGQSNGRGLTTALLRQSDDLEDTYLVATKIVNLLLLPSGPQPPNAPDLLDTERLPQVIELLKQHADIIIFNTTPLSTVLDAIPVARACDTTLVVVRLRSTHATTLKQINAHLTASQVTVLGVVINLVKTRRWGYGQKKRPSQTLTPTTRP